MSLTMLVYSNFYLSIYFIFCISFIMLNNKKNYYYKTFVFLFNDMIQFNYHLMQVITTRSFLFYFTFLFISTFGRSIYFQFHSMMYSTRNAQIKCTRQAICQLNYKNNKLKQSVLDIEQVYEWINFGFSYILFFKIINNLLCK